MYAVIYVLAWTVRVCPPVWDRVLARVNLDTGRSRETGETERGDQRHSVTAKIRLQSLHVG